MHINFVIPEQAYGKIGLIMLDLTVNIVEVLSF
jgi:hypothetical protein